MTITFITKENEIRKTFGRKFVIPLDFDCFKHTVYLYGHKADLNVWLEFNFSVKVFS